MARRLKNVHVERLEEWARELGIRVVSGGARLVLAAVSAAAAAGEQAAASYFCWVI
ncbi:MAG TPA: hypothetical protein VGL57_01960 [Solirubrobacteraceae bacterium]